MIKESDKTKLVSLVFNDHRKNREKEFHNNRYMNDTRKSISVLYRLCQETRNLYYQLIETNIEGKKVLEYGCGNGEYLIELAQKGGIMSGIDISPVAIELALKNAGAMNLEIDFQVMDVESMDFEDNIFDILYGSGILHHLDIQKSLKEIHRVLAPGGKAIFWEPLGHNPFINLFRYLTPGMRTKDEHPLLVFDLLHIQQIFPNFNFSYYHLTTFFAFPFIRTKWFHSLVGFLNQIDQILFKFLPFFKKYGWIVLIQIKK